MSSHVTCVLPKAARLQQFTSVLRKFRALRMILKLCSYTEGKIRNQLTLQNTTKQKAVRKCRSVSSGR